jgi:predicted O-methyltransferase YrrM
MKAPLHCLRYLLGRDTPETQTTAAERELLGLHIRQKMKAVELGVFEGFTTKFLADRMPPGSRLYAVDPFQPGRLGVCWGEIIARAHTRSASGAEIIFLKEFSHSASGRVDGCVDFIFFDGDHSWEGIHRDWERWAGKVAPSGICALHDTSVPSWDPARVKHGSVSYFADVIERDDRFRRVGGVDSLNILVRRG